MGAARPHAIDGLEALLKLRDRGSMTHDHDWRDVEIVLLVALNGLGNVKVKQKEVAIAQALFQRCIDGREQLLGKEHPDTLKALNDLANLFLKQGTPSHLNDAIRI